MSKDLYELIRSMNRSEKGYFKKSGSLHGSNGKSAYTKLFNTIDSMSVYDESELKKKIASEPYAAYLPRAKNYLRSQIMRALRSYHSDISVDGQLKGDLKEIEILYSRGLFKQCNKKTEVYSRIVGYFRPVENWNKGKQQEFVERRSYKVDKT